MKSAKDFFPIENFGSFSEIHKAEWIIEGLIKFSKISKVNNKLKVFEKVRLLTAKFNARKPKLHK